MAAQRRGSGRTGRTEPLSILESSIGGIETGIAGRRAVTIAVASALAVAAGVVVRTAWPSHHRSAAPVAVVAATPAETPVAKSIPPTHVAPARPAVPHDRVAAATPTRFEIKGPAFDIKANVCTMPFVRPLNPPGDQLHTVCWVGDGQFGVAPGYPTRGTSYILGHAWAEAKLVFNPMSEYAMREVNLARPTTRDGVAVYPIKRLNGYRVTVHTSNGVLTYVVRTAFAVGKNDAASVHSVMATTIPNRVVLITCGVRDGVDVDVNVIVYAYLVASKRT